MRYFLLQWPWGFKQNIAIEDDWTSYQLNKKQAKVEEEKLSQILQIIIISMNFLFLRTSADFRNGPKKRMQYLQLDASLITASDVISLYLKGGIGQLNFRGFFAGQLIFLSLAIRIRFESKTPTTRLWVALNARFVSFFNRENIHKKIP